MAKLGMWMELEIEEQVELLPKLACSYKTQIRTLRPCALVVTVARGSSDNAAQFLRYLFQIQLGLPVLSSAPSVLTRFGRIVNYPPSLFVAISQSGKSPDVVAVMEDARRAGHQTLAISNSPDSPLAECCDQVLLLEAGTERSVAATKTYSASILAALALAQAMGAVLPEYELPGAKWMQHCRTLAEANAERVVRAKAVFALGRGYSFGTAHELALKLIECARIACFPFSTADFEHGPRALASPESAAVVFEGAPAILQQANCDVIEAPNGSEGPIAALEDAFFLQHLALACARLNGLDPDHARNLKKVTETL